MPKVVADYQRLRTLAACGSATEAGLTASLVTDSLTLLKEGRSDKLSKLLQSHPVAQGFAEAARALLARRAEDAIAVSKLSKASGCLSDPSMLSVTWLPDTQCLVVQRSHLGLNGLALQVLAESTTFVHEASSARR